MACAIADLILVNVNPAFKSDELAFCLNKVGVNCLIMASNFKKVNYIDILSQAVPEISESKGTKINSETVPSLKFAVVLESE
jgi:fatty-acyl-CoA synthase